MTQIKKDIVTWLKQWFPSKEEINNSEPEYIVGTHGTTTTATWTGTCTKLTQIKDGTVIFFYLTSAGASNVTLNLTLANGTTTGAKNVYFKGTTRLSTQYPINSIIALAYTTKKDSGAWYVISANDNNSYNAYEYGTVQFTAGEALASRVICGAKADGKYYKLVSGLQLSTAYPLIGTNGAITSGAVSNNMYNPRYDETIANTVSGLTLTNGKPVYVEGTSYANGIFTVSSNILTQTLTSGRYYWLLGFAYGNTTVRTNVYETILYYDGTNLIPITNVSPIIIPNGTSSTHNDLNKYNTPGFYYQSANANTSYIDNLPNNTRLAFTLLVEYHTGTYGVKQTLTFYNTSDPQTFIRIGAYNGTATSGWGAWKEVAWTSDIPSLSNYIQKSSTAGLIKNDGTIDSNSYSKTDHTHSNYVNPTIVTNLTTNDDTKVLSAKQGKLLQDNKLNKNADDISTGYITAKGFKVSNSSGFLKADGSVDSSTYNNYSHPTNLTALSSGLYKITTNNNGHVTAGTAVAKADITGLGIPGSDTHNAVEQGTRINIGETTDGNQILGRKYGDTNGYYFKLKSGLELDTTYPIFFVPTKLTASTTNGYQYPYHEKIGVNLQTTVSGVTITSNKQVFVEGTALDKNKFTVSSKVFVSEGAFTTNNYYIPIGGSAGSTTNINFNSFDNSVYKATSATNLIPVESALYQAAGSYAASSHTHGNIQNNGVLKVSGTAQASKSVCTDGSGNITAENKNNHSHGSLASGGTLNSDISSVNKVAVTDSSNNLKTISKLPFGKLNISLSDLTGLGLLANSISSQKKTDLSIHDTVGGYFTSSSYIQFYKIGKLVVAYFRVVSNTNLTTSYVPFTISTSPIPSEYRPVQDMINLTHCHFNTATPSILTTWVKTDGSVTMRINTATREVNTYVTMVYVTN